MIGIIAAINEDGVIGKNGDIPWRYRGDFKLFRQLTLNSTVVMGRNTWNSLPNRPLPHRENLVVSRHADCDNVREAVELATHPTVWFIGGTRIYRDALAFADLVVLSIVPDVVQDADTFLPSELMPAKEHYLYGHPYDARLRLSVWRPR